MKKNRFKLLSYYSFGLFLLVGLISCGNKKTKKSEQKMVKVEALEFNADSAYQYIVDQCAFGPRIPNSKSHDDCGDYLVNFFKAQNLKVIEQCCDVKGYDGRILKNRNIIASYLPESKNRILICAHWDSRPWADNDPDSKNHKTPIDAANDGASGVAVMQEIARLINKKAPTVGVDLICFDMEDYGTPQWAEAEGIEDSEDSWCLGSQYWANNLHVKGYTAKYGILLDMVGGQAPRFFKEMFSLNYAEEVVTKVWKAARFVGYSDYFPERKGGYITDDHKPVNEIAHIPTIDIVPYYPDNASSSFGPTWHTLNDNVAHIDKNTLKAVGETLIQVIYSEK